MGGFCCVFSVWIWIQLTRYWVKLSAWNDCECYPVPQGLRQAQSAECVAPKVTVMCWAGRSVVEFFCLAADWLQSALEVLLLVVLAAGLVFSGFGFLSLKSVAYQPVPLSLNPAADICLLNSGCWQLGQSFNAASDIFCSFSKWWPQFWHWYS